MQINVLVQIYSYIGELFIIVVKIRKCEYSSKLHGDLFRKIVYNLNSKLPILYVLNLNCATN